MRELAQAEAFRLQREIEKQFVETGILELPATARLKNSSPDAAQSRALVVATATAKTSGISSVQAAYALRATAGEEVRGCIKTQPRPLTVATTVVLVGGLFRRIGNRRAPALEAAT
jgi:hypothetical protein